jgi:hypothetical protein
MEPQHKNGIVVVVAAVVFVVVVVSTYTSITYLSIYPSIYPPF